MRDTLLFRYFLLALHVCLVATAYAQQNSAKPVADTATLLHAIKNGQLTGDFRYFFSATDNSHQLTDYYAHAAGGALRYESGKFHGFNFGVNLSYVFNISSSDLSAPDSTTKQFNRYEIGLFDVTDPSNKRDITRLDELFIGYSRGPSYIRLGRQVINTPFINPQDGRMRPTAVEGAWVVFNHIPQLHLEAGWLYAISPRSTTDWYHGGASVGLYPSGITPSGKKSDYKGNISSSGVGLFGISYKMTKHLSLSLNNLLFDNVMNTAMLQADLGVKSTEDLTYLAGLQLIRQDALHHGGNNNADKTYINKEAKAFIASGRIGIRFKQLESTVNYTHIFDGDRYLMPREWGRDPFYTFIPRERNEGFSNLHAIVGKLNWTGLSRRLKTTVAAGYYILPDVKNTAQNKYGMPSYTQVNADIRYQFKGALNGLDLQLLVATKGNIGETYNDFKYEFNKVDMLLYNLVVNYHF